MAKLKIEINEDEAIVLYEWLNNFNNGRACPVERASAEKQALWDLQNSIAKALPQINTAAYDVRLGKARENVKNKELYDELNK
ncbi:hypothetical protein Emin_0350 [Elusimicrobium minutum Pei191]|uniref:Uncharacterized protein n=1 Tax=Elusimicrobium minutum (strain Pei191) TaxID=445932 RepID=B2KB87_ELUMP|nr:hypothetical protein [Elusimicrobium minutum]ACC97909.1 hypothetical protein Emin_0350 [Elusimicrobium minutum Pei191]